MEVAFIRIGQLRLCSIAMAHENTTAAMVTDESRMLGTCWCMFRDNPDAVKVTDEFEASSAHLAAWLGY